MMIYYYLALRSLPQRLPHQRRRKACSLGPISPRPRHQPWEGNGTLTAAHLSHGNPGGRPKLPAEMREIFQTKAPEAFEVLCKHLHATDPRVSVSAATQILDRAYGRPVQSIDVSEDGPTVRYYAEMPEKCQTTEEWLAGNPVAAQRNPKANDDKQTH